MANDKTWKENPMNARQVVAYTPFGPGDLVRLRSGGPVMTITSEVYPDKVRSLDVVWFGDDSQARTAQFPSVALCRVPEPLPPEAEMADEDSEEDDDEEAPEVCSDDEDFDLMSDILGGRPDIRRDPKKRCGCTSVCKCYQGTRVAEAEDTENDLPVPYQVDVFTPESVYRRDELGRGFPEDTFMAKNQRELFKILTDVSSPKAGICKAEVWIVRPPQLPLPSFVPNDQGLAPKAPKGGKTTKYLMALEMQRLNDFAKGALRREPAPREGSKDGARFEIMFTPTGIGQSILVTDLRTGESAEVADTESW